MQDEKKPVTPESKAVSEMASAGGKARAKSLKKSKRSEIAQKAALARWSGPVLKATHGDADHPLKLGNVTIPCYVLEDGTRVLSLRGMVTGMGMSVGRRPGGDDRLTSFVTGKAISPFVSSDLLAMIKNPIRFTHSGGGGYAFGYPATLLADLCDVVLEARKAGTLQRQQDHIATQAEILVRGFARVGIIALVDEATGYQDARSRDALAKILEAFVTKELKKWVSTFPAEYYKELFRLQGWSFPKLPSDQNKRPIRAGQITNDIVYERLAPGVKDELHRMTPRDEKGRLKQKLFQRLTTDVGSPRLKEHLASVVALMKASDDWAQFMKSLNRALPKWSDNLTFKFDGSD